MAQVSQFRGPAAEAKAKDVSLAREVPPVASAALSMPNGGLEAWLQVVGTFFIYFNTWGKSVRLGSLLHISPRVSNCC